MIKAVLVGARGYVGSELIKILSHHPQIELVAASSRSLAGEKIEEYSPAPLRYQELSPQAIVELAPELVFLALPNGLSAAFVEAIDTAIPDTVIVDLSADFRFKESRFKESRFELGWHYGLPEVYSNKQTTRISNPGCYATAMQLSVAPVRELVQGQISCFGVSGYSGAGTAPSDKNNPELLSDNLMPYKLTQHIHEQEVSKHLNLNIKFSPHVAEFFRGISLTSHIPLKQPLSLAAVEALYRDFYQDKALIKLQSEPPQVAQSANTHDAVIGGWSLSEDGTHLAVNCTLDNLLKGAATQAVQNANLAFQLPELTGIE